MQGEEKSKHRPVKSHEDSRSGTQPLWCRLMHHDFRDTCPTIGWGVSVVALPFLTFHTGFQNPLNEMCLTRGTQFRLSATAVLYNSHLPYGVTARFAWRILSVHIIIETHTSAEFFYRRNSF